MFKEFASITGILASEMEELILNKPWLYFIASYSQGFIYIGETSSQHSIIQRISEHFIASESSLKKNLLEVLQYTKVKGPYFILGFSLDNEIEEYTSKKLRLALESNVQHYINKKINEKSINHFNLISNVTWTNMSYNPKIVDMAEKIANESLDRLLSKESISSLIGVGITFLKI